MVELTIQRRRCYECESIENHLKVVNNEKDYMFLACGECGEKHGEPGRRKRLQDRCSECEKSVLFIHYNTVITGVKRGFLQKNRQWACSICATPRHEM